MSHLIEKSSSAKKARPGSEPERVLVCLGQVSVTLAEALTVELQFGDHFV